MQSTQMDAPVTVELQLLQQDLAGVFTSVPRDRIYASIHTLTPTCFVDIKEYRWIPTFRSHSKTVTYRNTVGCIFRGHFRRAGSHYRPLRLGDLPGLVMFWLGHSVFTVGTEILVQHRGGSMGSPMAPLCVAQQPPFGRPPSTN